MIMIGAFCRKLQDLGSCKSLSRLIQIGKSQKRELLHFFPDCLFPKIDGLGTLFSLFLPVHPALFDFLLNLSDPAKAAVRIIQKNHGFLRIKIRKEGSTPLSILCLCFQRIDPDLFQIFDGTLGPRLKKADGVDFHIKELQTISIVLGKWINIHNSASNCKFSGMLYLIDSFVTHLCKLFLQFLRILLLTVFQLQDLTANPASLPQTIQKSINRGINCQTFLFLNRLIDQTSLPIKLSASDVRTIEEKILCRIIKAVPAVKVRIHHQFSSLLLSVADDNAAGTASKEMDQLGLLPINTAADLNR